MNKVSFIAIAITTLGVFLIEAKAQASSPSFTQLPLAAAQTNDKELISAKKLPSGIKQALKSEVLSEWAVSEVYKVIPVAGEPTYEVYFTNSENMRAIARFDKEGNAVADAEY